MGIGKLIISACLLTSVPAPSGEEVNTYEMQEQSTPKVVHKVSYYGDYHHGKLMANGKIFNKNKLTCAATKSFKIGTKLKVTNVKNGKAVVVTVTDRGNFKRLGRTLDLSEEAFKRIGNKNSGLLEVNIKVL